MKVTVNFSPRGVRMAPYLTLACALAAIAAGMTAMLMVFSAREMHAERLELEEQLARFRSHKVMAPDNMLPGERLAVLRQQVQSLNGLTGKSGRPLTQVLATLEKLMPNGVWLTNLQYRPHEGETRLVVEADRPEFLTDFMDKLERSGRFGSVLLTHQAQRAEGSQRAIQFEIQLREQS